MQTNAKLIFIADNQDFTCEGIMRIVGNFFNNTGSFVKIKSKEELFEKLKILRPALFIVDYILFDFSDASELTEVKKISPDTIILIISDNLTSTQVREILRSGISHFITKSSPEEELISALKAIITKRKYISGDIYDLLISNDNKILSTNEPPKLSICETEVARLISEGHTTRHIAELKNLSIHTVNTHRRNIFRKLGINSSSELVRYMINFTVNQELT
jgi:DNA-binding NarL/FixJ family response regulator